ncbi:hypothetical protein DYB28_015488 [Aphanomyces astaci]|uniref:Uncharacterized protein n=1 Tax=Aphanomyces astaci TaxID=112090 RepID=A0A9X8DQM9_APHAT|nr:hypothetical protein DYB28_015488 [Aphanomyces astaci]
MRHYENQNTHPAMLFFNCIALSLSVSMTLMACATVFRWATVRKCPNHGTLFMVFFSLGMWAMAKLVLLVLVETLSGRDMWIGRPPVMYATLVSDLFFNATSLWFIFATYEFQRWVWRRRRHARYVLVRYQLVVVAICIAHAVSLIVVDRQNPPSSSYGWRRLNNTTPSIPGAPPPSRAPRRSRPTLDLMEYLFWTVYSIRWLAVLYIVVVGLVFSCRKEYDGAHYSGDQHKHMHRSRSSQLFVLLLLLLNLPYLVLEPLFDFGILDKATMLIVFSLSKCAMYLSGVGMVNLLGLYLTDFDALYTIKDVPATRTPSAFVVFDNSQHNKPTLVLTRS